MECLAHDVALVDVAVDERGAAVDVGLEEGALQVVVVGVGNFVECRSVSLS